MTEGDIAVDLLARINMIGDKDFIQIVPEEIKNEYINGNGAYSWWGYIRENDENRRKVIELIKKYIRNVSHKRLSRLCEKVFELSFASATPYK